jgi:hypothetical protein
LFSPPPMVVSVYCLRLLVMINCPAAPMHASAGRVCTAGYTSLPQLLPALARFIAIGGIAGTAGDACKDSTTTVITKAVPELE